MSEVTNEPTPEKAPETKPVCRKCGHNELVHQFRRVTISVGWNINKFLMAAPCKMCTQCGDVSVAIECETGDFLPMSFNQEPTAVQKEQLNRRANIAGEQIDEAIAGLQEAKAAKKKASKKKSAKRR